MIIEGIEVKPWEEVLPLLQVDNVIAVDIETTGLCAWRDRTATVQLYGDQSKAATIVQLGGGPLPRPIRDLFHSPDRTFVVHNGVSFDIPFLSRHGVDWTIPKWFDTLVAETVCVMTNRRDVSVSLRNSLKRRLGVDLKKEVSHGEWENAILTSDQMMYAVRDIISLPALARAQMVRAKETGQDRALAMEMRLVPVVAGMTIHGLPIDLERLGGYIDLQRRVISALTPQFQSVFGPINMNSPVQLKKAFALLGYNLENTAAETLMDQALMGGPLGSLCQLVLDYRAPAQRVKMYSDAWVKEHVMADGRVHPRFWQCSTNTGRFSSSDPNMQQVPRDGRQIFGNLEGHTIVSVDYSQIEIRVAAAIARDDVLNKILEDGDVHTKVAAELYHIAADQVTKEQRSLSKAGSFTLLFGGGAATLYEYARRGGSAVTYEQIEAFIHMFFDEFKGLARMKEQAQRLANTRRILPVTLPTGLRRMLVGEDLVMTKILNTMVQGTAAAGLKYGLLECDRRGLSKYLALTVHDENVAVVPDAEVEEFSREFEDAMVVGMHKVIPTVVKTELKRGKAWS